MTPSNASRRSEDPADGPSIAARQFAVVRARVLLAVAGRNAQPPDELEERVREAEAMVAATGDGPRMAQLADRLALTTTEVRFLWYAAAFSTSSPIALHAEGLGGPLLRRGLSVAVFAQIAGVTDDVALALRLAEGNVLVANGLLEVGDPEATPALRAYSVSARLVEYLLGEPAGKAGAPPLREDASLLYDASQQQALSEIAAVLEARSAILVVEGPPGSGRRTAIARVAPRAILQLGPIDAAADQRRALFALRRETCLEDGVPLIPDVERLVDGDAAADLRRFLRVGERTIALTSTRPGIDLGVDRPVVRVTWPVAKAQVRRQLWVSATGDLCAARPDELDELATRYRVGPGTIQRAVESARIVAGHGAPLDAARLRAGLRHNIAERMGELARRVDVSQSWDDAILPDDIVNQVKAFVSRVRHAHQVFDHWQFSRTLTRGAGAAALFSGPPGTGKTMVAGLIARELDLELYQVDLGQVVSKWVGETPKHLGRIFDAAEEGHALLLFDEADALFGQRSSEVKGAVDRYGNLEVNYILQRIEAFGGVTILTTNLDSAIDPALKRRLAEHVRFVAPDEDERERIWERMLATGAAPLASDLELGRLAREFKMTGANIRNAVLAAAFLAASEGGASLITQDHLARAARAEYRSMGHVLSETGTGTRSRSLT